MNVFITKYALTQGILEKEVEISLTNPEIVIDRSSAFSNPFHKGEWHKTREAAIAKAHLMRQAKIISLTKQINKLEKMTFI